MLNAMSLSVSADSLIQNSVRFPVWFIGPSKSAITTVGYTTQKHNVLYYTEMYMYNIVI